MCSTCAKEPYFASVDAVRHLNLPEDAQYEQKLKEMEAPDNSGSNTPPAPHKIKNPVLKGDK